MNALSSYGPLQQFSLIRFGWLKMPQRDVLRQLDPSDYRGVLAEDRGVEPRPLAAPDMTEPREFARRDELQRPVGRLDDLTARVELVAPGVLVLGDARVQHEFVAPAGDRDRVKLDRPELPLKLLPWRR